VLAAALDVAGTLELAELPLVVVPPQAASSVTAGTAAAAPSMLRRNARRTIGRRAAGC
jgi:hypothetical protein